MNRTTAETWRFGRARGGATRSTQVSADPAQFESVYRSCQADLYRYALSIVRAPHAAEEVLQNAMTRAMEALVHEQRDFELRPWLFRIVHNEAIDRFRRERKTVELDDAALAAAVAAEPVNSVAETAERNEAVGQLWKDLAGLPDRQRQALVLRELSGMGHEEIARVLDTSARAVKQTIFEARRNLLDCAEGRAMECADVQRTLSDGDGRVRRSRKMRAHLECCASCQAFETALITRPERLAALAPALPVAISASLLTHLFPMAKGAALASASSGASGVAALGTVGGLLASKVAVLASVGALAAGGAGVAAVTTASRQGSPSEEQAAPTRENGAGSDPAAPTAPGFEGAARSGVASSPASTTPSSTTPGGGDATSTADPAAPRGNSATAPGRAVSAEAKRKTKVKGGQRSAAVSTEAKSKAKVGAKANARADAKQDAGTRVRSTRAPSTEASSGSKGGAPTTASAPDAPAKAPAKRAPSASTDSGRSSGSGSEVGSTSSPQDTAASEGSAAAPERSSGRSAK